MSYTEYYDLYADAQKKDCPYIAFFIDIVNSKKNIIDKQSIAMHFNFIDKLTNSLKHLLKIDNANILNIINNQKNTNANLNNPIIIGDGTCYFFDKNKITVNGFINVLIKTIKETNYPFDLHFKHCYYETDNYNEANTKLYKGYIFRLLEDEKNSGIIINKNYSLNFTKI